jgi:tetratricopeptide (TPR) repeat protein
MAGQLLVNRSMGTEARGILEPAVANLSETEPDAAPLFAEVARVYMMLDRNEEAVDRAEQALRSAAPERDTEVIAHALITQGSAISNLGRFDEGEAILRGAMVLADREGHIAAGLRARNNLLSILVVEAPLSTLLPLMNESVELALRYGMGGWGAQHLGSRAYTSLSTGDWDQARADLAFLADWDLSEIHTAWIATLSGTLDAASGDQAAAEARLADARAQMAGIDTLPQLTSVAIGIATARAVLGEWSAALDALTGMEGGGNDGLICQYRAFAAAGAGDRDQLADVWARTDTLDQLRVSNAIRTHVRASLAACSGQWDEARAAYAAAMTQHQGLDFNFEGALLGLEFGAFLGARFEDARTAGDAAAAWFAERGATSVVDRYHANFRGTPAPPTAGAGTPTRAVPVDAEQRA